MPEKTSPIPNPFPIRMPAGRKPSSAARSAFPLTFEAESKLFSLFKIPYQYFVNLELVFAMYLHISPIDMWNMPWYVCMILAMIAGGIFGLAVGFLKAYANVNEVISGIMLNWIGLYLTNMILGNVKESTSPYTVNVKGSALIPSLGLSALFSNNKYVTIAVPLSIVFAILVWVVLEKTKFGYELRATGYNKDAAKYAGMNEKKNIILTLMIGGCLAGLGAAFLYLTGYEQWSTTQSSVPSMGFNGIAATFLGGLSPIGTIFASFFIQHITSGGSYLDKSVYPSQISDLISAIIIYLCGFVMFFKLVMNRRAAAREEAKAEAAAQTPAGASVSAAAAADARQNADDGKEEGGKKE